MPQVLKDEVQRAIAGAALEIFAARGFAAATVAEIARAAGVSTGNIYRYYETKEVLFDALVPASLAADLLDLVRRRVLALAGVEDVRALPPAAPYHVASEALMSFCVEHRLQVAILLGRAEGTRHEGFPERLVRTLADRAVAHVRGLGRPVAATPRLRFVLEQIYGNFVAAMARALLRFAEPAALREVVDAYARYHLAGLAGLFR